MDSWISRPEGARALDNNRRYVQNKAVNTDICPEGFRKIPLHLIFIKIIEVTKFFKILFVDKLNNSIIQNVTVPVLY